MTNGDAGSELGDEVMHSIADEYGWPDYRSTIRIAVRVDPKILAQYVGTFELRKGFDLVVTLENGQLITSGDWRRKSPTIRRNRDEVLSNRYPSGNRIRQRWPRQGDPSRSASERTRHESAEKVAAEH